MIASFHKLGFPSTDQRATISNMGISNAVPRIHRMNIFLETFAALAAVENTVVASTVNQRQLLHKLWQLLALIGGSDRVRVRRWSPERETCAIVFLDNPR